MILTIRTDKPDAELGLYDGTEKIAYDTWTAHRELGSTINMRIEVFLQAAGVRWDDLNGIVFYEGPGSFTGLRIGASVVNALGYAYGVPVASAGGDDWHLVGIEQLLADQAKGAIPYYGADAFTTKPKK